MWLRDYHLDGLRLDAVHALVDTSAVPFLEQLAAEVRALEAHLGRHLVLIAESDLNDPRLLRPPSSAATDSPPSGATISTTPCTPCSPANAPGITRILGRWPTSRRPSRVPSSMTAALRAFVIATRPTGTGLTGHHFLGYLQNHDQVATAPRGAASPSAPGA